MSGSATILLLKLNKCFRMENSRLFTLIFLYSSVLCFVSTQPLKFQKRLQHGNFNFKNCNRSAVPFYITSLYIGPDPIQLGQAIFFNASFSLDRNVGERDRKIEIELNIRLKTDKGYTELCEIIGEDECHFNDLCARLKKLMKKAPCPPYIFDDYHNNCSCPFTKQNYKIKTVPVPVDPLPFQLSGAFDITVNLQEQGTHIGCVNVEFCITKCKPLGQDETRFFKDVLKSIIKRRKDSLKTTKL